MASKTAADDTDDGTDYRVLRWHGARVLFGNNVPLGDIHALLRQWEMSGGYRWTSTRLAAKWGAAVVALRTVGDEDALLTREGGPLHDGG